MRASRSVEQWRTELFIYSGIVIEAGSRRRSQPAPPHVVFEALTEPNRDPARRWLLLLKDEQPPQVIAAERPNSVVWSSLWAKRPDAQIRFDLSADGSGARLSWALFVVEPLPDSSNLGHMRKRINELINANLRFTFGQ
jgi:hypothetical protein